SSIAAESSERRFEKNLQIEPKRLIADVMQIHAHHLVKGCPAATIDLPFSRDSRPRSHNPSPVPQRIVVDFVTYGRARTDQRHVTLEDIDELRQLIQTGFPDKPSYRGDSRVVLDLKRAIGVFHFLVDEIANVLLMDRWIVVDVHRTELKAREFLSELSHPLLLKENRSLGRLFDQGSDDCKQRR